MKTYAICPISNQKINETVARLNGLFTVFFLITFAFTGNVFIIILLLIDFYFRSANLPKYSVFAIVSKSIAKKLELKERFINAGPKIFAARIGLVFTVIIFLSIILGFETPAYILSAIFGLCAFLEAAFGLCIACEVYPYVYKLLYQYRIEHSSK